MGLIHDHDQYTITASADNTSLLLDWKRTPGLPAADFASGISQFANQCKTHRPGRAIIDARRLDQTSPAIDWLRGQGNAEGLDPYQAWWEREIVPLYNAASISALTVATGDPEAPGAVPTPVSAKFGMGYFTDLESARAWEPV